MKETIDRRREAESPLETAARIRAKYGIVLTDQARKPLPKRVFDEMWGDDMGRAKGAKIDAAHICSLMLPPSPPC